ncbi:MAG: 16S rRNA (cytidine(1402)-2'-O)-methyltransferase [Clostridiales bacterium]|nr:16S rRNA (cytidine(1402)-2'-O)-methyltransferase [Candidatus Equinaster intestinalis]
MAGKLFVVGTPIGNLGDFSPRAKEVLSEVDFIAAEDTRVSVKLLNNFGIKKPLISYFEHNKAEKGEVIADRILRGESCAIVTDAGMPAISDPGEDLVRICLDKGIRVESVPGPTALCTALAISGMSSGRFCFEGFLSVNKPSRKEHLESLQNEKRTMIFYEAPHKLCATLEDFCKAFGENRKIAVIKELTKIHETVLRMNLGEAVKYFNENQPKGEYVLIVDGKPEEDTQDFTLDSAVALAKKLMENGTPPSLAAKEAAGVSGFKKGDIYKAMM